MKFVKFTATVDLENRTIELPDSPDAFSTMFFDGASGEIRAVYTGELPLTEVPRSESMGWESDVAMRQSYIAMRRILTKKELHLSFTPTEYRALTTAAQTDDNLYQLWNALNVADFIDLDAPETVNGMAYIVGAGLLTPERHDEIMSGLPV